MEAKLRSISKRIPWSLLVKAGVFALAWFALPWWLFFLVSCYLYLSPSFQSLKLIFPFALIVLAGTVLVPVPLNAVLMGIFFLILLGIKELFFIRRSEAYELLVFLLFFLYSLIFFGAVGEWRRASVFLGSFALSTLFFFCERSLLNFVSPKVSLQKKAALLWLSSLLLWQMSWALLFLPLAFFHQAAILFLVAAFFTEFLLDYAHRRLRWEKLVLQSGTFFLLVLAIFWITDWGL